MRLAFLTLLLLTSDFGLAQDLQNMICGRIIVYTPEYERILLPKGHLLGPEGLRGPKEPLRRNHRAPKAVS